MRILQNMWFYVYVCVWACPSWNIYRGTLNWKTFDQNSENLNSKCMHTRKLVCLYVLQKRYIMSYHSIWLCNLVSVRHMRHKIHPKTRRRQKKKTSDGWQFIGNFLLYLQMEWRWMHHIDSNYRKTYWCFNMRWPYI